VESGAALRDPGLALRRLLLAAVIAHLVLLDLGVVVRVLDELRATLPGEDEADEQIARPTLKAVVISCWPSEYAVAVVSSV
jgi:hypothetical protein